MSNDNDIYYYHCSSYSYYSCMCIVKNLYDFMATSLVYVSMPFLVVERGYHILSSHCFSLNVFPGIVISKYSKASSFNLLNFLAFFLSSSFISLTFTMSSGIFFFPNRISYTLVLQLLPRISCSKQPIILAATKLDDLGTLHFFFFTHDGLVTLKVRFIK